MKDSLEGIISKVGLPRIQAVARSQMVQGAVLSLAAWGAINIATWFFFGTEDREFLSSLTTNPGGNIVFLLYGGLVLGAVMLAFALLALVSRSTAAIILNGFSLIAIGIWNIIHDFVAMQALRPYGYTLKTGPVSFWAMFGIIQIGWGLQQFSSFRRIVKWSPARLGASEVQEVKEQLQDFVHLKESIAEGIVKASITTSVLGMISRTNQFTGRLLEDTALMVSEKLDDCFTVDRKDTRAAVFPDSKVSIVSVSVQVNHAPVTLALSAISTVAIKVWCGLPLTIADFNRLVPPGKKGTHPSLKMLSADLLKPFLEAEDSKVRAAANAVLDAMPKPAPDVKKEIPKIPEPLPQEPFQVMENSPMITVSGLDQPVKPEQEKIQILPDRLPEAKPALETYPPVEVEDRTLPSGEQTLLCPHCRQEHLVSMSFCPMTGKKIIMQAYCPQCSKQIKPGWSHCGYCGGKLTQGEGRYARPEFRPASYPLAPGITSHVTKPRERSAKKYLTILAGGIGLLFIATAVLLNTSRNRPDGKQIAAMTMATWTTQPTRTPLPSLTASPVPTATPLPTLAKTLPPVGEGWRWYSISGFYLAMPQGWQAVDVTQEGAEAILNLTKDFQTEWAQNIATFITTQDFLEMTRFWAIEAESTGVVSATVNVVFQTLPFSQSSAGICAEIPPAYEQLGIELLSIECGLEINDLDVALVIARLPSDSYTIVEEQYFFVQGLSNWILTLSVDESRWENYQPVFDDIANTFRIGDYLLDGSSAASVPGEEAAGKIAFTSDRNGNWDIFTMDADGSHQTRLTGDPAGDGDPSWSPDGQKIAFASERDGNWEIYVMNADGSNSTRLTDNPARDADPAWSPDGQKIAFSSNRAGDSSLNPENSDIYVMDADGGNPTRLTYDPADDLIPNWSPDMQKIVFTSNRNGNGDICIMNADGSNQIRLTSDLGDDGYPAWSPDGQWIVYNSNRDGNWEIYGMSADGSAQTNLSNDPADDGFPEWSAGGQKIAFSSARSGNWEIYVMYADGSNPTPLTNDPGYDSYPDLSSFTDQGVYLSNLSSSTATPVSAPSQETLPTSIQFVSIVSHEDLLTSLPGLWLEFAFLPGEILPGSQIEASLNNGFLELTLPGGEVKTFPQVPHATSDLKETNFENYGSVPSGPQIRIPLETLADILVIGQYQVTWQSGIMRSNTLTFEWDGTQIIIFEP